MKFVILCNGTPPSKALLEREMQDAVQLICCDGAADTLEHYGIEPHLMIGDFDSLGAERSELLAQKWGVERIVLNPDKDKTDSQVALELAMQAGAKKIVLLGATGTRMDHTFANITMMILTQRQGIETVMYDSYNEIRVTCNLLILPGKIGDTLSILPLGVNCAIRVTDGLQYPLYDYDFDLGDNLGVSNQYIAEEVLIEVAHGWFCIMRVSDTPIV